MVYDDYYVTVIRKLELQVVEGWASEAGPVRCGDQDGRRGQRWHLS